VKKNLLLLFIGTLILGGCHAPRLQQVKPVLGDRGVTCLYVSPFPQEAERLSFTLAAAAAVREDGVEIPLPLRTAEFRRGEQKRQRLMASSPLPPGRYKGFTFKVKNASLKGEEGEAALLLPEEPALLNFAFEVGTAKALLVSLTFKYEESLKGIRFSPVFSAAIPGRPLVGLTGYVTNYGSNTITVFDKKTGQAVDMIQTGQGPAGIVIDQQRRKAYVVLSGDDAIEVIDMAAGTTVNRIRLNPGDAPRDLALTPDGKILISANTGSDTVSMIDPASLLEFARISLLNRPGSVMIDRSGRKAYIFNTLSNNVSVLDITGRVVTTTFATDAAPLRGDFNRKGDRLIIFHGWSPHLLVVDPLSLSLAKRVYAGIGIGWVKVDTITDDLYVGMKQDRNVEIYDPFSFIPSGRLATDGGVSHMAIDGEENNLYLIHTENRIMQIINLVSRNVVGEIDLDDNPYWVTLVGER